MLEQRFAQVSALLSLCSSTHTDYSRLYIVCVVTVLLCGSAPAQIQKERDDLYSKFVKAIHEVQQKTGFKNLLLEKKLTALADTLEKKVGVDHTHSGDAHYITDCIDHLQEAQLNEVLSASNLDPSALTMVTRKLEVCACNRFYM